MRMKRFLALLLIFAAVCAIPVPAAEPESSLPPIYVGVQNLEHLPQSWNPLEPCDGDQQTILHLTGETLYRVDETGMVIPAQAEAHPVDVTEEFAGTYGIPRTAVRGYAFSLEIREDARWEDGKTVSAADWFFTVERLLESGSFPLEIVNYDAFRQGATKPSDQIISLKDAGFGSMAEAEAAGHKDFYIDLDGFWGLETGWLRISDRTRLLDAAIPSGCEEMYLTAEYLYRNYLSDSGSQKMFQSEFLGIPVSAGKQLTMGDVGLIAMDDRLVLILQEPTTAGFVSAALTELVPVRPSGYSDHYGTADSYVSCGPYRIVSVSGDEIRMEPNPHWTGTPAEFKIVCCRADG